jgi:hypothetical protein
MVPTFSQIVNNNFKEMEVKITDVQLLFMYLYKKVYVDGAHVFSDLSTKNTDLR